MSASPHASSLVRPYGTWPAPISAETVAAQGVRLGAVAVDGDDIYWIEGRPHEGGRISPGPLVEGKYAVCPLHNYKFDPKSGENVEHLCKAAKRYRVREENGDCEIWV